MQINRELLDSLHFHVTKQSKSFSTAAVPPAGTADASSTSSSSSSKDDKKSEEKSKDGKSKKGDDSNIFLDNLGKIFLSTIGLVLFMLLRSTVSNNSRQALREEMEAIALLDPLEIDDLRLANSEFTVEVWERIVEETKREFGSRDSVTYPEFLSVVVRVMRELKGEGFTVQFGHLVDRIVIAELERVGNKKGQGDINHEVAAASENELPLTFLFATLSLALQSTVADRVRVLYESMLSDIDTTSSDEESTTAVSGEKVAEMLTHLQNSCQLVPVAQIVETNSEVPYQTFRVGNGDDLAKRAREGYGGKKGSEGVTRESEGPVSLEEFHAILKTKTVCAWGECYVKKTGMTSTSDR